MKKGCLTAIVILVGLIGLFIYSLSTAFDTEYDKAEIKQKVGGTLICNSVYNADHHSWQYDISYKYKPNNDSIIDIGSGTYYGREWNKDEQLLRYKNWLILKTGGWIGTDKIIVGNLKNGKWNEFEFTPESIEKEGLWQQANIQSLTSFCCSEAFIENINNGQIVLNYKYRTSEMPVNNYGQSKVYYIINDSTGIPEMIKVK
ncbi:hypothetical protein I2I11_09895 [Pontibacter sp. 172403-2]|uniref:hypothetical protein n=1 Tax=Pontibacter rufus TaxID=2791028 RepID=UPI0018AFA29F|nr:hypothetical protein [Pontibacter sp. 172403-2]MBF9253603.1 hypothetical protein [Pontibacter sp. 172403-2]